MATKTATSSIVLHVRSATLISPPLAGRPGVRRAGLGEGSALALTPGLRRRRRRLDLRTAQIGNASLVLLDGHGVVLAEELPRVAA